MSNQILYQRYQSCYFAGGGAGAKNSNYLIETLSQLPVLFSNHELRFQSYCFFHAGIGYHIINFFHLRKKYLHL